MSKVADTPAWEGQLGGKVYGNNIQYSQLHSNLNFYNVQGKISEKLDADLYNRARSCKVQIVKAKLDRINMFSWELCFIN